MYSIGSSEIVNGEMLALFRCDDGHQMWLSNYDEEKPAHIYKELMASRILLKSAAALHPNHILHSLKLYEDK